jgi:hypothetical protein
VEVTTEKQVESQSRERLGRRQEQGNGVPSNAHAPAAQPFPKAQQTGAATDDTG